MSVPHLSNNICSAKSQFLRRFCEIALTAIVLLPPLFLSSSQAADVQLAWDPNPEADVIGYKVYYGTASGSYSYSVDVGNRTDCIISDLEAGKTYFFAATAYNSSGKESSFSAEVAYVIPGSSGGPSGSHDDGGGGGGGGGCFIATAAYGTSMAPEVLILKEFRDAHLLTNPWGRSFVRLYYRTSPSIARCVQDSTTLRTITRCALIPVIYGVKYPISILFVTGLVIGSLICYKRATAFRTKSF